VERRITVMGVSQELQGFLNSSESITDARYAEQIIGIISDESIDIIFEEALGGGRTTAHELLHSLKSIRYRNIDPHPTAPHDFGFVAEPGRLSSIEVNDEEAKREDLWCKGIAEQQFESALVICGYLHTLTIVSRLRTAGFRVKSDYCLPPDVLSGRRKGKRVS